MRRGRHEHEAMQLTANTTSWRRNIM